MLLADTGPLVGGANSRDRHHQACRDLLLNHPGPILVPAPVVVEVCQLLASRQGTAAEAAFLRTLGTDALTVVDLEPARGRVVPRKLASRESGGSGAP